MNLKKELIVDSDFAKEHLNKVLSELPEEQLKKLIIKHLSGRIVNKSEVIRLASQVCSKLDAFQEENRKLRSLILFINQSSFFNSRDQRGCFFRNSEMGSLWDEICEYHERYILNGVIKERITNEIHT